MNAAVGAVGYDPTALDSSSPAGFYVQESGNGTTPVTTQAVGNTIGTMSTAIGQLLRWPALPKYTYFQPMTNNEAYYRDAFIALTYTAFASHDGQQWTVKATIQPASGGRAETIEWSALTWYAQVGGTPSCFYAPGWIYYICGTQIIDITAYTKSQCRADGVWTMEVYEDGGYVGQRQFTMLPQVPENDLTVLNQLSPHSYDTICYKLDTNGKKQSVSCSETGAIKYTIKQKGCALTSSAMVLNYHGAAATPDPLDEYLVGLGAGGYDSQGHISWFGPAQYSGGIVHYIRSVRGQQDAALKENICKYGPQILHLPGHFVMTYGRDKANQNWLIYDPGTAITPKKAISSYLGARYYGGQQVTYVDPLNQLVFRMYSPAELLVTAPDGKRTGFDPTTGRSYEEIPGSAYIEEAIDDDETGEPDLHPVKTLSIAGAAAGEYVIQATGTATASGTYDLEVVRAGSSGNFLGAAKMADVPVSAGEVHQYSINYLPDGGATPTYSGGYDGGGQKPADVNRFLRYGNPGEPRVSLPAGTISFRLVVSYDATVNATSFSAVLNGASVSHLFAPVAGKTETVSIPLTPGSNTLKLSIDGTTGSGRYATDTDRLVFLVQ